MKAGIRGRRRRGLFRLTWLLLAPLASALVGCYGEAEPAQQPEVVEGESPFRYPPELWDSGVEGETILMVHVTRQGTVDSAYVLESSGEAAFDSAAVNGARDLRFSPARRGEARVAAWARLPVRFHKEEAPAQGAEP
jgi:periplasmic protein TonB